MIRYAHGWAVTHLTSRSGPQKAHRPGLGLISLAGRFAPTRGLTRPALGRLDVFRHPARAVDGAEVPLTLGHHLLILIGTGAVSFRGDVPPMIGARANRGEGHSAIIFEPDEASRALQRA